MQTRKLAATANGSHWLRLSIVAYDLKTGERSLIAQGSSAHPVLGPWTTDRSLVVWAESAGGSTTRIVARRLDGTSPFEIARVTGVVLQVALSGDTVAWLVRDIGTDGNESSWIETAKVPR